MTKRIDWEKSDISLDSIYDWCDDFTHFYYVSEELSDVGITVEEVEKQYEEALVYLKKQLDKIRFKEDDNDD